MIGIYTKIVYFMPIWVYRFGRVQIKLRKYLYICDKSNLQKVFPGYVYRELFLQLLCLPTFKEISNTENTCDFQFYLIWKKFCTKFIACSKTCICLYIYRSHETSQLFRDQFPILFTKGYPFN